jgi:NNP family nitrate/nitrite transporter-like MFS transporter
LFASLMFVLGCAMGIGKASVFKYIPDYFPRDVAAVGGVVAMLGALGGFILPPAFGSLARISGAPQVAFTVLLGLTLASLVWLHVAVTALSRPVARRKWGRESFKRGHSRQRANGAGEVSSLNDSRPHFPAGC